MKDSNLSMFDVFKSNYFTKMPFPTLTVQDCYQEHGSKTSFSLFWIVVKQFRNFCYERICTYFNIAFWISYFSLKYVFKARFSEGVEITECIPIKFPVFSDFVKKEE